MTIAGFAACAFLLEFQLHQYLCFWSPSICWIHFICFSFVIPNASIEWITTSVHPAMGSQHICLQCGIHILQQKISKGITHSYPSLQEVIMTMKVHKKNIRSIFQDMMIWETIGLWHYSIPGLFLLAQFCLGVFVALCNLVNNSVFLYLTSEEGPSSSDDHLIDGECITLSLISIFIFIFHFHCCLGCQLSKIMRCQIICHKLKLIGYA